MFFDVDGWIVLAIILYMFIAIVALFFAAPAGAWVVALGKEAAAVVVAVVVWLLVFGGLSVGLNALAYKISERSEHTPAMNENATVSDVTAEAFGFQPEVAYPLLLGSQTQTLRGEGGGFLSFYMWVSGGPAITVSFSHDGKTYPVSLPRDRVVFTISDKQPASVLVRLENPSFGIADASRNPVGPDVWSQCEDGVSSLLHVQKCIRTPAERYTWVGDRVRQQGLAPIVEKNFISAEITLSPQQYAQLIGSIK